MRVREPMCNLIVAYQLAYQAIFTKYADEHGRK